MIRSFVSHYQENAKLYEFKIRLACECTDNMYQRIENALDAYHLESLTKPKTLPIQEDIVNFPQLGPVEICILEAQVHYPATPEMIEQLLIERCGLDSTQFVAHTAAQDEIRTSQLGTYEKQDALLDTELSESDEPKVYGNEFISDFLDSIETRQMPLAADATDKATSTNDLEQGNESPVGSAQQNKVPTPEDM